MLVPLRGPMAVEGKLLRDSEKPDDELASLYLLKYVNFSDDVVRVLAQEPGCSWIRCFPLIEVTAVVTQ